MSGKHTPGPWAACDTPKCKCGNIYKMDVRSQNGQKWIGQAFGAEHVAQHGFHFSAAVSDKEQAANARLIAAAPDLLEVVIDIVSDCEKGLNPGLYALAVAALAKAEGRE